MQHVYTVQLLRQQNAYDRDIPVIDVTVKSGDAVFAPRWEYVWAYKSGTLSEEKYRQRYSDDMKDSMQQHPERWNEVLAMDSVALACYCSPDAHFCHRWQLRDIILSEQHRRGEDAVDAGEL